MATFPTTFASASEQIKGGLGEAGDAAIRELDNKGFIVLSGFTEYLAGAMSQMAAQPHIREYCPKDMAPQRFATQRTAARWLGGGRGVVMLAKDLGPEDGWRMVGYGWAGTKHSPVVLDGETTFAVRLGQEGLGQKLAAPFSRIIIEAAIHLYSAQRIWLETWQSNAAAEHTYAKLGFEVVARKPDRRINGNGEVQDDTRVYMILPT